jgi:hypothetical protein
VEKTRRQVRGEEGTREFPTVWERLEAGEVSLEAVAAAYDENLELTLPHVETVLNAFTGTSVITSDHGNLVGEQPGPFLQPMYGHQSNIYAPGLRKVPWLVVENQTRKRVVQGDPSAKESEKDEVVAERLADLGYVDA